MTPDAASQTHEELQELLGAYALDALPPAERAALDAHLADCPTCRAEVGELRSVVAALPLLAEEVAPPPSLRARIESSVRADLASRGAPDAPASPPAPASLPRPAPPPAALRPAPAEPPLPTAVPTPLHRPAPVPFRSAVPLAAAAALLLAVALGLLAWNLQLRQEIEQAAPTTIALVPADTAVAASGQVEVLPEDNLLLLDVRDLPPLAPGEVYQVWLLGPDGTPTPAGVFAGTPARHAIAADPAAWSALAITNEPGPLGSPGPTGRIVATAPLSG